MMARGFPQEISASEYRLLARPKGMTSLRIEDGETDMQLYGTVSLDAAAQLVREARSQVLGYISGHPDFRESLAPFPLDPLAQPVVREMLEAGVQAELGPMAAVAGAIAEFVGRRVLEKGGEVIAENGGDVFFRTDSPQRFAIVAESSSNAVVGIEVAEARQGAGRGVCTSSGRLGPSMNFGGADAVTVVAGSAALADALATAASNRIRDAEDIGPAMEWAGRHGAEGIVVIAFDRVAAMGAVRFTG